MAAADGGQHLRSSTDSGKGESHRHFPRNLRRHSAELIRMKKESKDHVGSLDARTCKVRRISVA